MITHFLPHELKQPTSGAMLWSHDSLILFGRLDCNVNKRFAFFYPPPITLQLIVVMTLLVI